MGIQRTRPGYTVWADRQMLGDSKFVIQAALEYGAHLSEKERGRLTPMAQLELLLAIDGEEERGRLLGGRVVGVEVVGDDSLQRFFGGHTGEPAVKAAAPRVRPRTWGALGGIAARSVRQV
jgi:hypothetical protein